MKPRLRSEHLTPIDLRIMQGIRARWKYPLNHWYHYYDRSDADLMLRLASRCRSCGVFRMWAWFWSEQLGGSVWQRCRFCGNIRCASQL